jgi:hypothetical protein
MRRGAPMRGMQWSMGIKLLPIQPDLKSPDYKWLQVIAPYLLTLH